MASFTPDYLETNLELARSGLRALGFEKLYVFTSNPPKLAVNVAACTSSEQIDEVIAFLEGIEHIEGVRVSFASC